MEGVSQNLAIGVCYGHVPLAIEAVGRVVVVEQVTQPLCLVALNGVVDEVLRIGTPHKLGGRVGLFYVIPSRQKHMPVVPYCPGVLLLWLAGRRMGEVVIDPSDPLQL